MTRKYLSIAGICLFGAILGACNSGKQTASQEKEEEKETAEESAGDVNFIAVQTADGNWCALAPDGSVWFENEFKGILSAGYNGVFSVTDNSDRITVYTITEPGKYAVLGNLTGLEFAGYMSEGLIPVCFPGERISVYDNTGAKKFELGPINGQEVTNCQPGYSDGLLGVRLADGNITFVNKEGKQAFNESFSGANKFVGGLAVVGNLEPDYSGTRYFTINPKGETVFRFKFGQSPQSDGANGFFVTRDFSTDQSAVYTRTGEPVNLPSYINNVMATNGKYFIYAEGSYSPRVGVVTNTGKTVIEPEYEGIVFKDFDIFTGNAGGKTDMFLCMNNNTSCLVDTAGKVVKRFDYSVMPAGKFGYIGNDGKHFILLNEDGTEKCKKDFYEVNWALSPTELVFSSLNGASAYLHGDDIGDEDVSLFANGRNIFQGTFNFQGADYGFEIQFDYNTDTRQASNASYIATGTNSTTNITSMTFSTDESYVAISGPSLYLSAKLDSEGNYVGDMTRGDHSGTIVMRLDR